MAYVRAREHETLESLMRRFKKACDKEEIMKDYKDKQYYIKPSLARHQQRRTTLHKLSKRDE